MALSTDLPVVGVVDANVAICPFCSEETGYTVRDGAVTLNRHHLPASREFGPSRPCPDSLGVFHPFYLSEAE